MLRLTLAIGLFLLPASAFSRDYCQANLCFQKKARVSCLKPAVWGILHKVAARVGRIEVTCGCGGKHARRAYHYSGQAVDFRPMQASPRTALAVLRSLPEVGGIGTYSNGLLHADVGARKFAWHGHGRARVRYAKARRSLAALQPASAHVRVADGAAAAGTFSAGAR